MKKIFITLSVFGAMFLGINQYQDHKELLKKAQINSPVINKYLDNHLNSIKNGALPIRLPGNKKLYINFMNSSTAQEAAGDPACEKILDDARQACMQPYPHGALSFFNGVLCKLNDENGADVENVFCHFRISMGIEPDLSNLPVTETKTFGSSTINVNITSPTEDFATTNGYIAKATVTVNESPYMVVYWGFANNNDIANADASKTKGFLIEGFVPGGIGGPRASYMQWDLTGTTQTGKVLATEFPSAEGSAANAQNPENHYLNSPTADEQGDRAYYGRFSINTQTNETSIQGVSIEQERGTESPSNFGCFKIYGIGTKGGQMVITKTRDAIGGDGFNQTGDFTGEIGNSGSKTFVDMDGACLLDSTSTPNETGNLKQNGTDDASDWTDRVITALKRGSVNTSLDSSTNVFDMSCDTLNGMSTTGGVSSNYAFSNDHGNSWVDFAAAPSDVFPTVAAALEFPSSGLCDNVATTGPNAGTDSVSGCYCGTN